MPTPTPIAIFFVSGLMPLPEAPLWSLLAKPPVAAADGLLAACVTAIVLLPLTTDVTTTNDVDGVPLESVTVTGVVEGVEDVDEVLDVDDVLEVLDVLDVVLEDVEEEVDEVEVVVDAAAGGSLVAAAPPPPGPKSVESAAPTPLTAPFPPLSPPLPALPSSLARSQKKKS
jgi:hypothetical protein